MNRFVRMPDVRSRMSIMEAAEARGSTTPEVIALISNKGLADAARIVKVIIITPIAVIIGAIEAVVIAVVVHRTIYASARRQCEQRRSAQGHFHFTVHIEPSVAAFAGGFG